MFKNITLAVLLGFLLLTAPSAALAQTAPATTSTTCPEGRQCLESPLKGKLQVTSLIGTIIKAALGVVGSVTLFMLVLGGFKWLTSAGNDEKVHEGTQTMLWAVIGLAVVFGSYLFLTTYVEFLTGSK